MMIDGCDTEGGGVSLPPLAWDELPALFPGLPGADRWLPLLQRHAALVEAAAPAVRVTSVSPADVVRRQYAESLELWRLATGALAPDVVVDVGSGGGYPGMVIATVAPHTAVHLVEPLRKRARLLEELAVALGLANVTVHPQRAEEAGRGALREAAALVTARAVAALPVLLEYTAPLARPGGMLALAKGSGLPGELAAAGRALALLGCGTPLPLRMREAINGLAYVLLVPKAVPTPAAYPRRPGMATRRPL
jgi:16S rRNA (guanine527-N7)-methyltransferase